MNNNIPFLVQTLESIKKSNDCQINSILSQVSPYLSSQLLALLNLTLKFRFFHPKSSIQRPISNSRPSLPGYSIYYKTGIKYSNFDDIQWKLISAIYSTEENITSYDRFNTLKEIIQHFPTYSSVLFDYPKNNTLINYFKKNPIINHYESIEFYVNGRKTSLDPISSISSFIDETN